MILFENKYEKKGHHLGSAWRDFAWNNSLALSSWKLVHKTLGQDWTYSYVVFENSNQDLEEGFRPIIPFLLFSRKNLAYKEV